MKYKFGAGSVKYKLELGVRAGAGGWETQIPDSVHVCLMGLGIITNKLERH